MSALRCRHKCQFVFALIFVDFLKGFLGSFEVPKLKKTLKFKLGGEIRMQMSFWSSPDRLFTSWEGVLDPLCRPRGSPGAPLGSPGCPQNCPNWGPEGVMGKTWHALFSVLGSKALLGGIWEPFSMIFVDFLRFYEAKVEFPNKNITFACITAMSGVCYAGKNAILKKKQQFYLHNRHLGSIPSACYAGKSDDWKWENPFLPA